LPQSVGYGTLADNMGKISEDIQRLRWKLRVGTGFRPENVSIPKRFSEVTTWKGPVDRQFLEALKTGYGQKFLIWPGFQEGEYDVVRSWWDFHPIRSCPCRAYTRRCTRRQFRCAPLPPLSAALYFMAMPRCTMRCVHEEWSRFRHDWFALERSRTSMRFLEHISRHYSRPDAATCTSASSPVRWQLTD